MSGAGPAYDLAIVGGGLVGASLAAALRHTPMRIALIEAHAPDSAAQPSFDERTTALGNASRRIFEGLGIWTTLEAAAAPITGIHVSDATRFSFARLAAADFGQQALGYVVPNRVLGRTLWEVLQGSPSVHTFMPARLLAMRTGEQQAVLSLQTATGASELSARLVVAADGAHSVVRDACGLGAQVDDYGQVAIVTSLRTDLANDGVAYERFTSTGPMALLPLASPGPGHWRTLVWAARPEDAERLMQSSDAAFLAEWQQAFGWRAGRALQSGRRARYPLALSRAQSQLAPRTLLLGNAAQTLHPVAGQGFNLGLRDVADLAELLGDAPADPGSTEVLAAYAALRRADREGVIGFTDTLVRMFTTGHPLVAAARDAGLLLFDMLPPAKRALSRVSLGFGARTPRLARGLLP
ncbi:MAG TPA: 2-octaprenyl-6-methoxyphenyl hydroxylase [Steroidobacteraceae bacterium]|nr:2-octaprenyl-6-methoxyphenyl hydroxylase [Steroidobacteraceae bacterium]